MCMYKEQLLNLQVWVKVLIWKKKVLVFEIFRFVLSLLPNWMPLSFPNKVRKNKFVKKRKKNEEENRLGQFGSVEAVELRRVNS